MFHLLSKLWPLLLVPGAAGAFVLGFYFYYYEGDYEPPPSNLPPFERFSAQPATVRGFTEVLPSRQGVLLVDMAHLNNFNEEEINVLLSRVADLGYTIQLLKDPRALQEKLEIVDSFLVILPGIPYSESEVRIAEDFIQQGGKLLLVGDPGRPNSINSLAKTFGIVFQRGYLYNMVENDLNFQYIFIKDFRPDDVTDGLQQIALYTAGIIRSSGLALALTDENTYSSAAERIEPFAPLVKGNIPRVLAISDLTFMIPPQNDLWDNGRLIANLADYLTKSERALFQ